MTTTYPLSWPADHPRSRTRQSARFDTTFTQARDGVLVELRRLGAKNVVISTNIELRQDGLPYANRRQPGDSGVAVYFTMRDQQLVLACDKWQHIEDNLQAVRKTVEAMRGLDRWGVSEMLKRMFSGFKQLPAQASSETAWWVTLGVDQRATPDQVRAGYLEQVKLHHPDHGGSREAFEAVSAAYQQAQEVTAR